VRATSSHVGARGIDCVTVLNAATSAALMKDGADFCFRYLGSVTPVELAAILDSGLAFMPVTFADQFDPVQAVQQLRALGIPPGTTVWLDCEGLAGTAAAVLIPQINGWADAVVAAGWEPGLYCGSGSILTSAELYALRVVRYWHGMSRVLDRNGQLAEPMCGWCCYQLYPTQTSAGVQVDFDFIQQDTSSRLPVWVVSP
jgi:hypothetical protein